MASEERKVQYEEMKPGELEHAVAEFPVVYCAFGSLEWHGRHLPVGTDTIKAHNILIKTAEKYGGVVAPPTYWGFVDPWKPWTMNFFEDDEHDSVDELYRRIFLGFVNTGFKVVIGVTGHDYVPQLAAIQAGVDAIETTGKALGFATMDGDLIDQSQICMDHAAAWEASHIMYARPELVNLNLIEGEVLDTAQGKKIAGISGPDPREFASADLGERLTAAIADALGEKARQLLAELESRDMNQPTREPRAPDKTMRELENRREKAAGELAELESFRNNPAALDARITETESMLDSAVEDMEDAIAVKLGAHAGKALMEYTKRVNSKWPTPVPLPEPLSGIQPPDWWRAWKTIKDANGAIRVAASELKSCGRKDGSAEQVGLTIKQRVRQIEDATALLEEGLAARRAIEGDTPFLSTGPPAPFMDWVHREVIHTWQMPKQPSERASAMTPLEWYRVWEAAKTARLKAREILVELERLNGIRDSAEDLEGKTAAARQSLSKVIAEKELTNG